MKFRGAGQGPLALVAAIIAGELARRLRLRVPELVLAGRGPRRARPADHRGPAARGHRAGPARLVRRPRRGRLCRVPPGPRPGRPRGDPAMTESEVFQYALIRVVPRVERGEAVNVGVIV